LSNLQYRCPIVVIFNDYLLVPLKTIAAAGEMNFAQIQPAKDAGCLDGSQGFCGLKMSEIQPPAGDESF